MQALTAAAIALFALVAPATAASIPPQSPFMGAINTPEPSTLITGNTAFPFEYAVDNWCEEGYNHFEVYLTSGSAPPTYSDLAADGSIPNSLFSFGEFAVANFGLPAPSNPPPSELTMPAISSDTITEGSSLYLTVVQIFESCPGHEVEELGVTSVPVTYSSS